MRTTAWRTATTARGLWARCDQPAGVLGRKQPRPMDEPIARLIYTNQERNEVAGFGPTPRWTIWDDEQLMPPASERMSGYVLGYCHGMIFAEHLARSSRAAPPARCRARTLHAWLFFVHVRRMPPSWMHLGGAQSWAPLPEKATNFGYRQYGLHRRNGPQ